MNIRHRKDVTIIQWPKSKYDVSSSSSSLKGVSERKGEKEEESADSQMLWETLNNPSAQSFQMSPALDEYIQYATSASFQQKKGGQDTTGQQFLEGEDDDDDDGIYDKEQVLDERKEEDASEITTGHFVDLREVPFKVSQIAWNYNLQQSRSVNGIKPTAVRSFFEEVVQFEDKTWIGAETSILQSVMETFHDISGNHGVYTIYWKLQARKSESSRKILFDVLSKGKQVPNMSSFRSIDDWPEDVVWFRTILDIQHDGLLFPFRACTYNFLVSRKENIVFGWTCATIQDPEAIKAMMEFFTEVVFQFLYLFEEAEAEAEEEGNRDDAEEEATSFSTRKRRRSKKQKKKKKAATKRTWKFIFTRSFSMILQQNAVLQDVLTYQDSETSKLIAEGAFELAVDVRMIHALLQTPIFRSAFQQSWSSSSSRKNREKSYLSSFLSSVIHKAVVSTAASGNSFTENASVTLKQKERMKIRELSARKVWSEVLHLGTYRKQGISLPVYTAFLYKDITSSSSLEKNDKSAAADDVAQNSSSFSSSKKEQFERDVVQKIIAKQLDVVDNWNQMNVFEKQNAELLSLYIDDPDLPPWTSCFLLGLMETGDEETSIVKEFSPSEQGIEERLRALFVNMFFVNEMEIFRNKIDEMENELSNSIGVDSNNNQWKFFLIPVLLCRKPTSMADPALQNPLLFWQTYGECGFYVLVGRMKDSISETSDKKGDEDMSMISIYPYNSSLDNSLSAWEEFMLETRNEELFPLQHDIYNDDEEDLRQVKMNNDVQNANHDFGNQSNLQYMYLDSLSESLEMSFLCLQRRKEELVSPFGWSTLLANQEYEEENEMDTVVEKEMDSLFEEEEEGEDDDDLDEKEQDDDEDDNL